MAEKIRVGIVGANWGLLGHLPIWRSFPDVEVVAICTRHRESAEAAALRFEIPKAYWDHRHLLEDSDIDIIDVGTMPATRQAIVLDALAARKHVLTCNPFATDVGGAERQLAAQRENGVVGAIEAQMQWQPQFRHARDLIEQGYLGELHGVTLYCHYGLMRSGDATYPALTRPIGYPTDQGYNWLGSADSGASALRNLGGHCLHGLVALFGEIESVAGAMMNALDVWNFPDGSQLRPDTQDTAVFLARFRGGGIASLNIGWSVPHARGYGMEAWGSEGRLRIVSPGGFPDAPKTKLYGARMAEHGAYDQPPLWPNEEAEIEIPSQLMRPPGAEGLSPGPYRVAMHGLFSNLIEAVRNQREASPNFAQACHIQDVCDAVERSARTEAWVQVPRR